MRSRRRRTGRSRSGCVASGAASNSGEGGEDPAAYEPDENGELAESAIKQVASARFGVTTALPGPGRAARDQDGPGEQARRGRPAPGEEGDAADRRPPPRAGRA